MFYLTDEMCREIISDHISSPRNINKPHNGYSECTLKNPSCGDLITVYVSFVSNIASDITYEVEGCSICRSSASMMSELLLNKNLEEIKNIISNFNNMVLSEEYDEDLLEDATSLRGVSKQHPRIKCATLCYKAFEQTLNDNLYNM